jgi:hypothetical protein
LTATSPAPCTQHNHRPTPTYSELHHIIPQAWQVFWQPPKPWENQGPSPDRPGVILWDARTIVLCRTGHGNVHFWLVRAMRSYLAVVQDQGSNPTRLIDEAWSLVKAGAKKDGLKITKADMVIARMAMERWEAAGGSLIDLCHKGLWGEI